MSKIAIAQFTAGSTARDTYVQFGFVPDFVLGFADTTGTNPNQWYWFNKGGQTLPASFQVPDPGTGASYASDTTGTYAPPEISQWGTADTHILNTGSTGVLTQATSGIAAYFGGDVIAADETINSNPVHPFTDGTFPKTGARTLAGIKIPAAKLTADKLYVVIGIKRDEDAKVAGLTS